MRYYIIEKRRKQMTITTENLIILVARYNLLLDRAELGDEFAEKDLDLFLEEYPNIGNYDSRGNYIGRVYNENGWTP
jgi:hypothetical protein